MDTLFKFFLVVKTLVNFQTAILDKLGLIKVEIVYRIRGKKMKFYSRGGTEDMAEIVVVTSGYEYKTSSLNLPKNPTVVDLGGHIGTFSIFIADFLKNKSKIFAFEPDKENFKLLIRNINLNKAKSVRPKNLAISDYVGKGFLKREGINTDAYSLDSKEMNKTNCFVSTLPVVSKSNKIIKIDLLKIDVEGAEYKIFNHKDSYRYIKNNVHYIFMEYHDISKQNNYSSLNKIIKNDFSVLNKRSNILTLKNLNWNEEN